MTFPSRFRTAVGRLTGVADALGADWMLVGAAAVAHWGFPRATQDVDFAVLVGTEASDVLDRLMAATGFEKVGGPEEIVRSGLRLSRYWLPAPKGSEEQALSVDVFFTSTEWQHEAMGRRVRASVRKGWPDWWIPSAEDLLLYKLAAFRAKDMVDLEGIMDRNYGAMDWGYVHRWAGELGFAADLDDLVLQYQVEKGIKGPFPWEEAS